MLTLPRKLWETKRKAWQVVTYKRRYGTGKRWGQGLFDDILKVVIQKLGGSGGSKTSKIMSIPNCTPQSIEFQKEPNSKWMSRFI